MVVKKWQKYILGLSLILFSLSQAQVRFSDPSHPLSNKFHAVGPDKPVVEYLKNPSSPVPRELSKVAVEVHFDLVPHMMRFSMPCYPCQVTENNIHYSNGWTETYDPKASSSCEVLWDRDAWYARMWIESQNPARIIVRVRAAIADPDGYIAHSDIPSGSPYGKGDWTDEWYYIYPDGTHTRHVRIYTGLAEQSLLVTDETFQGLPKIREIPPRVVHEFHEEFIFGQNGHVPEDDIESAPMTLIMMDGRSKTISYKPYPKDFGEFAAANITVINLKSKFRPFIIAISDGLEHEPYPPEGAPEGETPGELLHIFQTWMKRSGKDGYSASLGHLLNWWHYRRTENILEQVYLSGMTEADDPADELIQLAKSWLRPPWLKMEGLVPRYNVHIYDPAQGAFIIPSLERGPRTLEFTLEGYPGDEGKPSTPCIVNPTFLVKDWGEADVAVTVDGESVEAGRDFRFGYEETHTGKDLVLWFPMKAEKSVVFNVTPVN